MLEVKRILTIDSIYDLQKICWSGALDRINDAIENNIDDEFFDYIVSSLEYEEELTDTMLNDFIWFDCDNWLEEHKTKED